MFGSRRISIKIWLGIKVSPVLKKEIAFGYKNLPD